MADQVADWRPPGPRDWKCDYDTTGSRVHIRPRNDLIWHPLDDDCLCGPTASYVDIDSPVRWVIVHHALDGRQGDPGQYTPADLPTAGPDDADGVCA